MHLGEEGINQDYARDVSSRRPVNEMAKSIEFVQQIITGNGAIVKQAKISTIGMIKKVMDFGSMQGFQDGTVDVSCCEVIFCLLMHTT